MVSECLLPFLFSPFSPTPSLSPEGLVLGEEVIGNEKKPCPHYYHPIHERGGFHEGRVNVLITTPLLFVGDGVFSHDSCGND